MNSFVWVLNPLLAPQFGQCKLNLVDISRSSPALQDLPWHQLRSLVAYTFQMVEIICRSQKPWNKRLEEVCLYMYGVTGKEECEKPDPEGIIWEALWLAF